MADVLAEKYATSVLKYLLNKEYVTKQDLSKIVKSPATLDKLIFKLEKERYLNVKEQIIGRRTYSISLTEKGRLVAEQLKRIDHPDKKLYEIPDEFDARWKKLSALIHINVMDDHITIKETNYEGTGRPRIFNIYVKVNGRGVLRLWCEIHESFDCYHTKFAWSLPEVQEMIQHQILKGNVIQIDNEESKED